MKIVLVLAAILFVLIVMGHGLMPVQAAQNSTLDRAGMTATFADEFDQLMLTSAGAKDDAAGARWRTHLAYSWLKPDDIAHRTLAANKEEQLYVDSAFRGTGVQPIGLNPFSVRDGVLMIAADRAPDNAALSGFKYVSGLITTKWLFNQQYGVFEMRARLPRGKGLWPAFWLLPQDGSWPPEIDIMEVLGHETNKLYTTLHSKQEGKHVKSEIPAHVVSDMAEDFHTYGMDWGPQEIVFYFDDKEIARRPTPPDMHKPFYIIANLAVGGGWPGSPSAETVFPARYEIDWIRVWQRPEYAAR